MVIGVKELLLILFSVVAIHSKCDRNFRHIFFESDYDVKMKRRTRVVPITGCHMKNRIQACVDETTKNFHAELDAVDWKLFAETYVKCVLNTVFPENVLKDEQNSRFIYPNGEKLSHIGSNDTVLRATYYDVEMGPLDDINYDGDIIFLSRADSSEREMNHTVTTRLSDTAMWESGHNYATRIEGNVNIGIINFSGGFDLTGEDRGEGKETTNSIHRTTSTLIKFQVPKNKFIRTLWTAKREKGNKKFLAKVLISGWLWVNQTDQIKVNTADHPYIMNEFLFPVGDMAYYFEKFFTRVNSQSLYDSKQGSLATTDVIHTVIQVDEYNDEDAKSCRISKIDKKEMFLEEGLKK
uniref:Scol-BPFTx n=1 Tax=Scolopendra viridis TaxID=118503 RepID=A0A4D5R8Y0_SCOVI